METTSELTASQLQRISQNISALGCDFEEQTAECMKILGTVAKQKRESELTMSRQTFRRIYGSPRY